MKKKFIHNIHKKNRSNYSLNILLAEINHTKENYQENLNYRYTLKNISTHFETENFKSISYYKEISLTINQLELK